MPSDSLEKLLLCTEATESSLNPNTILPVDIRTEDFEGGRLRGAIQTLADKFDEELGGITFSFFVSSVPCLTSVCVWILGHVAELIVCNVPPIQTVIIYGFVAVVGMPICGE